MSRSVREKLKEILYRNMIQKKWNCVKCGQEFLYEDIDREQILAEIINAIKEKIPKKMIMVNDNFTYGDTKHNSNAVRYGFNEAIDTITTALSEEGK